MRLIFRRLTSQINNKNNNNNTSFLQFNDKLAMLYLDYCIYSHFSFSINLIFCSSKYLIKRLKFFFQKMFLKCQCVFYAKHEIIIMLLIKRDI